MRVRVEGRAQWRVPGQAQVAAARLELLGPGAMPEPVKLPVAHLFRPEFSGRWIEQEGIVSVIEQSRHSYQVTLLADDAPVDTFIHLNPGEDNPARWLNRKVRMRGVCVTGLDAEGRAFGFELHVPSVTFISEVTEEDPSVGVLAPTALLPPARSLEEARVRCQTLLDAPRSPANETNPLPTLTQVQQVLRLGVDGARTHPHPVRLVGLITYPRPGNRSIFVDDGTGGIEVAYGYTDRLPDRRPGVIVWIDGVAGAGPSKPWIAEARLRILGNAPLPTPRQPPAPALASARWHGEWIEIEGVVRDLTRNTSLTMLVASGEHHVEVEAPYSLRWPLPGDLLEARVRVRGLCEVPVDFSGRPTQARLLLNDTNAIEVVRAGRKEPFEGAETDPEELRARRVPSEERLRTSGVVLFHSPDGVLYLRDRLGAVRAELLAPLIRRGSRTVGIDRPLSEPLAPGDRVALVGAPAASLFAPRLVDAEYRRRGPGPAPEPLRLGTEEASSGRHDGDWVVMKARVEGHESRRGDRTDQEILLLEDRGLVFEAQMETPDGTNPRPVPANALVEVTGICSVVAHAAGTGRSFRLLVPAPANVRVEGIAAPWLRLQPGRVLAVSAGLGMLAVVWVAMLRRQVGRRTAALRAANEQLQYEVNQRRLAEESLRSSEARKTAVLESALDSIITLDHRGRILDVNPAAEKTFGHTRAAVRGKDMLELMLPAREREHPARELNLLGTPGPESLVGRRVEITAQRRTGEEFPAELAIARIETGGPPLFTAQIQDISERKRAEAERERALAHEKELGELKSRFVSMVSHEYRTPLGIITSSAEILEAYLDRLSPEERQSNLRDITDATRQMARLMEEVLLLGRVEAGKMTCRATPCDLIVFGQRVVDEISSSTNRRCPIQFTAPGGLAEARADESLLRHIFINLLSNATKYSPEGSMVEFQIEARGHLAIFTVRDRGIGIPEADVRLLFQAFHRGRNVGETPGTGLGMTIVKRCVELHGGKIAVESHEGRGTRIVVALPLYDANPGAVESITQAFRDATPGRNFTVIS
jgi:PAS domain S-box-containing protein